MSATCKPGTVALVRYETNERLAFAGHQGYWTTDHGRLLKASDILEVTPMVCLELTRIDADTLHKFANLRSDAHDGFQLCARIINVIREQTPEPEPAPRWSVMRDHEGWYWLRDDKRRDLSVARIAAEDYAQAIADALNAADKEQS